MKLKFKNLILKFGEMTIKKTFCLFILIFNYLIVYSQNSQPSKNILLIGNSLTYYNNMGVILSKMLKKSNYVAKVYEVAKPGIWLQVHYNDLTKFGETPKCRSCEDSNFKDSTLTVKLEQGENWDWVILQEAPVRLLIPESREKIFKKYTLLLDSLITNAGGKTVLFCPYTITTKYPYKYCNPANIGLGETCTDDYCCSEEFISLEHELQTYINAIGEITKERNCAVAPIGKAFYEVSKLKLPINLLNADKSHPSRFGSFLMACIYHQVITKSSPIYDVSYMNDAENEKYYLKLIEISKSCFKP